MTNPRERLEKLETSIKELKENLQNAEKEKEELLKEIYGSDHNVIDAMPARVRNVLKLIGVNTDLMLQRFLDGNFKKDDMNSPGTAKFHFDFYEENANSREERLMSLRGVGKEIAAESVCIANEKGL